MVWFLSIPSFSQQKLFFIFIVGSFKCYTAERFERCKKITVVAAAGLQPAYICMCVFWRNQCTIRAGDTLFICYQGSWHFTLSKLFLECVLLILLLTIEQFKQYAIEQCTKTQKTFKACTMWGQNTRFNSNQRVS